MPKIVMIKIVRLQVVLHKISKRKKCKSLSGMILVVL